MQPSPDLKTIPGRITDLSSKVNTFNDTHGTFTKSVQAAWVEVVKSTKTLVNGPQTEDSAATVQKNAEAVQTKIGAFSAAANLDPDDQAGLDAIIASGNALIAQVSGTTGSTLLRAEDPPFGAQRSDVVSIGIRNLWDKVMLFSRTHGPLSSVDRANLDGVVVATATLISDPGASAEVNKTRIQTAVNKIDQFNQGHSALQPPDSDEWDGIVGAINALALETGAGTGTMKRK